MGTPPTAPGWLPRLRTKKIPFPRSLLGGVRGFLLAFVLLSSGPGVLPAIAFAANEPVALRVAAALGIVLLDAW